MGIDTIRFPHLGWTFLHVGSGISIGSFEIRFYGIVIAAAMVLGIWMAMWLAGKTGQDPDTYFNFAVIAVLLSVLGARIYYVIFSWDYYGKHPAQILDFRGGGLAIYGGAITGILCAVIYCIRKKLDMLLFLDTGIPALTLGQAVGRWGNFFNREAFGKYTDSLLAMQLPISAVRAEEVTEQMQANAVVLDGVTFIQVHPTFLYESAWNLALLGLMVFLTLRGKKRKGDIFLLYLAGYGTGRFWIESLRTDQLLLPGTSLAVSQGVSVLLVLLAAVLFVIRRKRCRE